MERSNGVLSRGLRRVEQLLRGPRDARLGARGFRVECRLPLGDGCSWVSVDSIT